MKRLRLWCLMLLCAACVLLYGMASADTTTVMMYMCGTDIQ